MSRRISSAFFISKLVFISFARQFFATFDFPFSDHFKRHLTDMNSRDLLVRDHPTTIAEFARSLTRPIIAARSSPAALIASKHCAA